MNGLKKFAIIALAFLYILSPVDICSGSPVDDIIIAVLLIGTISGFRNRGED